MSLSLAELEQKLLDAAQGTRRAARTVQPAPAKVAACGDILHDDHASASGCFQAVLCLCGDQARAWEPESIWLTLDRRHIDIPVVNRDKVMAALTLTMVPAFWWDVHAFENTVLAFNHVVSNPAVVQEATPGQMAWGVYEAELIFAISTAEDELNQQQPEFDREPVCYTAAVLHRAGYVRAPDLLNYAQRELTRLNKSGTDVNKADLDTAWTEFKKRKPLPLNSLDDTALDVQLARLASVELHVQEQLKRYQADLQRLR